MTRSKYFRVGILIAAALASSSCGIFKKGKTGTPVLGERIPVLSGENDLTVDPATTALPMTLPPPVANNWTQSGGDANKSMGQLALGTSISRAFTVQAGRGSTLTARLAAEPIVAGNRLFSIDTLGVVRAFDARTGAQFWSSATPIEKKRNEPEIYGGGLAYDQGRIYATNGLGFVVAMDEANGRILWKVRPGGPLRGAPSVGNGSVYVMSQDDQIYSLKEEDGSTSWSEPASLEVAGVFGSASPAIGQGTVVAGFSSGELNAYRYENGRQVWGDQLQRTSIRTSVSTLNDVDADPIIDNGQVIAIGAGGRMVALDLITGQREWEINAAGISTPWLAGDWIFVVTDDAKLLCVYRQNGHIRWITQMQQFEKPKSKKGQIEYSGPVLAGGRLIVTGSNGALIFVDPTTGRFLSQTRIGAPVSLSPIVANSTLYILDDRGRITAFR